MKFEGLYVFMQVVIKQIFSHFFRGEEAFYLQLLPVPQQSFYKRLLCADLQRVPGEGWPASHQRGGGGGESEMWSREDNGGWGGKEP